MIASKDESSMGGLLTEIKILRMQEELFTQAIAAADVGIWSWEVESGELFVHPGLSNLLGIDEDDAPEHLDAWLQWVHIDDRQRVHDELKQFTHGGCDRYQNFQRMV